MILVIGDLDRWAAEGRELPPGEDTRFARPDEIDPTLIARLSPSLVLAPLKGPRADALDIALRLWAAGYRGRFRAVSGPLPHADLVRQEIAESAPGLDFDIVLIGGRLN